MPTRSRKPGTVTSDVEVAELTSAGLWIVVARKKLFVDFHTFPWFKSAPETAVRNVEQPSPGHLYWPDLDVDLDIESITAPEKFPLVWK